MAARDEVGASAVEYGLLISLIAAVVLGAVLALGTRLGVIFTNACNMFPGPTC